MGELSVMKAFGKGEKTKNAELKLDVLSHKQAGKPVMVYGRSFYCQNLPTS